MTTDSDPGWDLTCGLYAYVGPTTHEILYVGKVDGTTVRGRWTRSAKEGFWDDLERDRHIFKHAVLVGEIELKEEYRLSRQLLADIESLLIKRLQPRGNIQSRRTRISRSGLRVQCKGTWPLERYTFRDAR